MFILAQVNPPMTHVIAEGQALAIITTYLLLFSFILVSIAAISFIFNFRKTGCAFLCLYGLDIFAMPMHITGLAGLFVFGVGVIGIVKVILEPKS